MKIESKMELTIYPDILVEWIKTKPVGDITEVHIRCFTILRRKHEGLWYRQKFMQKWFMKEPAFDESKLHEFVVMFNKGVYVDMLYGIVHPEMEDQYNNKMYELDPDQRDEDERLGLIITND